MWFSGKGRPWRCTTKAGIRGKRNRVGSRAAPSSAAPSRAAPSRAATVREREEQKGRNPLPDGRGSDASCIRSLTVAALLAALRNYFLQIGGEGIHVAFDGVPTAH